MGLFDGLIPGAATNMAGAFAEIEVADVVFGTTYRFWLGNRRQMDGKTYELRDLPYCTGVEVTQKTDSKLTTVTFSLDMPFHEGMELIDSTLFNSGNLVAVRFGYTDSAEARSQWYMMRMDEKAINLTISADGVSGQIAGALYAVESAGGLVSGLELDNSFDESLVAARDAGRSGLSTDRGQWTLKAALQDAAKSIGYEIEFGSDASAHLRGALFGRWVVSKISSRVDMIASIVREVNKTLNVSNDSSQVRTVFAERDGKPTILVFTMEDVAGGTSPAVACTFVMRGRFDMALRRFPILSFSPNMQQGGWWVIKTGYNSAREIAVVAIGEDGVPVKSLLKVESEKVMLGDRTMATSQPGTLEIDIANRKYRVQQNPKGDKPMRMVLPPPVDKSMPMQDLLDSAAKAYIQSESHVGIQKMTLESVGLPWLMPGMVVGVEGCGIRFDGQYQIMELVHKFSGGVFSTSLEMANKQLAVTARKEAIVRAEREANRKINSEIRLGRGHDEVA